MVHVAAAATDQLPTLEHLQLFPVEQIPHLGLKYDHADPHHLLGDEFTLLQLERVHEAIAGQRLTIDGFRRRMVRNERVIETGRTSVGTVGKPTRIYRRAED